MNIADLNAELEKANTHNQTIADIGYTPLERKIKEFFDLNDISKSNIRVLNIKYRKRHVLQLQLWYDKHNKSTIYTRERIQRLSNKLSMFLADGGFQGMLSTALKFDDLNWRSGYLGEFGSAINLYEPSDSDLKYYKGQTSFEKVDMYVFETGPKKGGSGPLNDCLYDCLALALLTDNKFKNPQDLKKFLKIGRIEKVDIAHIPLIETKLKGVAINITGDHTYTSTVKSNKVINIKLIDGHYKLDNSDNKKVYNVSYREKPIIMFNRKTKEAYDGTRAWTLTLKEIKSYKDCVKSEFLLVHDPYIDKLRAHEKVTRTLKESYDQFILDANELKTATKGIVNLYKTGEIRTTALNLFDKFSKTIAEPEKIMEQEAKWIEQASVGALITSKVYEGPAYEYDFKSMYPNEMNGKIFCPVKAGEFKRLTQDEFNAIKFYSMGIYRCVIEKSTDDATNRFFRFNTEHYYTHYSLNHARILDLKIVMIEDSEPNWLHYSRDKCLTGHEIFGKFIDFTFELKEKKLPFGKSIINILWGALSHKITKKHYGVARGTIVNITENQTIVYMKRDLLNEDEVMCRYQNNDHIYKNNFARICPFIMAKGRLSMASTFYKYKDQMIKMHTDSFLTAVPIPVICCDIMGGLVCKYSENIVVKNNSKPQGEWESFDNNAKFNIL